MILFVFIYNKFMEKIVAVLFVFVLAVLFAFPPCVYAKAQTERSMYRGAVAVFAAQANRSMAANSLAQETVLGIRRVFSQLGRFRPLERKTQTIALSRAGEELAKGTEGENKNENIYHAAARIAGSDLCVTIFVTQSGKYFYSDLRVKALNPEYKGFETEIRQRSVVQGNIPLKAGREIAIRHRGIPVQAEIIRSYGKNLYLIGAGGWHGLKSGVYAINGFTLEALQCGRYESLVRVDRAALEKGKIVIRIFPDTESVIADLEKRLELNALRKYGLYPAAEGLAEKRYVQGICIINPGGNILLPGYGAFLSTYYLGFRNPQPDWISVALSSGSVTAQIALPALMSGFEDNIFPWEEEGKTERMLDLQIFLWSTLPVTFTVAYLDQLACQFRRAEIVPPFFKHRNNTAFLLSALIPGGGLFYKGHRVSGWSFYFSEMSLAGYAVYNRNSDNGRYALYALGGIKIIDIVYAYFASSSYSFYNIEMERDLKKRKKTNRFSLSTGFESGFEGEGLWRVTASYKF